ncbi:hypothetical protein [Thermoactinospora rubra]|uniref:hypothetical protein n=1 Tax=Thermoactinospora rubra TaxID=1088767 RepID=UPI003B84764C
MPAGGDRSPGANHPGASRWNRCAADDGASRNAGDKAADAFSRAVAAASARPISRSDVSGTPDRNSASASARSSPVSRVR